MKIFNKVVAWLMCLSMVFVLVAPAYASQSSSVAKGNYWDFVGMHVANVGTGTSGLDYVLSRLGSLVSDGLGSGQVCDLSTDHLHHGEADRIAPGGGRDGNAVICVCDYCGQEFTVMADLSTAYDNSIPDASVINSDGSLIVRPTWFDFTSGNYTWNDSSVEDQYLYFHFYQNGYSVYPSYTADNPKKDYYFSFYFVDDYSLRFVSENVAGKGTGIVYHSAIYLMAPIAGTYYYIPSARYEAFYTDGTGAHRYSEDYRALTKSFHSGLRQKIGLYDIISPNLYLPSDYSYVDCVYHPPVFRVIPDTAINVTTGPTYNTQNRPTSITGNYGIVGPDGTINNVTQNTTIVNETTNTYTNPATGTTNTISDWSYDYSDRSYTLNLEGGDTSTVTYGDENVSITENHVDASTGDTVTNNYTVYYIIGDTGSGQDPAPSAPPSPSAAPHVHNWQLTDDIAPTCTLAGDKSYLCATCGQIKHEAVPALGHDWQIKQQVPTEYDDTGQLVKQGYIIYECSRCGEQYKDEANTGPPGEGGDWFGDALRRLGDILTSSAVWETFQKVSAVFSEIWSWLPEEISALLVLGVTLMIVAAIIKAFL